MHKDFHVGINPNVSRIIINSSLGFIAKYHALLTSLHSNWEMVNEHLASVQMSVTYKRSKSSPKAPCSYLSVSVAVKDIKNILVTKLTLSGDNLKSLSK